MLRIDVDELSETIYPFSGVQLWFLGKSISFLWGLRSKAVGQSLGQEKNNLEDIFIQYHNVLRTSCKLFNMDEQSHYGFRQIKLALRPLEQVPTIVGLSRVLTPVRKSADNCTG